MCFCCQEFIMTNFEEIVTSERKIFVKTKNLFSFFWKLVSFLFESEFIIHFLIK